MQETDLAAAGLCIEFSGCGRPVGRPRRHHENGRIVDQGQKVVMLRKIYRKVYIDPSGPQSSPSGRHFHNGSNYSTVMVQWRWIGRMQMSSDRIQSLYPHYVF